MSPSRSGSSWPPSDAASGWALSTVSFEMPYLRLIRPSTTDIYTLQRLGLAVGASWGAVDRVIHLNDEESLRGSRRNPSGVLRQEACVRSVSVDRTLSRPGMRTPLILALSAMADGVGARKFTTRAIGAPASGPRIPLCSPGNALGGCGSEASTVPRHRPATRLRRTGPSSGRRHRRRTPLPAWQRSGGPEWRAKRARRRRELADHVTTRPGGDPRDQTFYALPPLTTRPPGVLLPSNVAITSPSSRLSGASRRLSFSRASCIILYSAFRSTPIFWASASIGMPRRATA